MTLNTTATTSPPMTPPAITETRALDLGEDVEELCEAECEDDVVEGGGVDVGVATINSGL